ncbi:MAG: hypothetical protein O7D34_00120 [Ignavibacteria bacterium]|nr:hypothetical protein [Ignavibacteria bacterium]
MSLRNLVIIGVLMELCYLSFYFVGETPDEVLVFIVVSVIVYAMLAFIIYHHRSVDKAASSDNRLLALIIGFAILFRLTLVPHAPVASDDIYRYIWDGKVAAHGINPFALSPNDSTLEFLHTTDLPSKVNFPNMRTIYPPLAQIFFWASHILFGDSVAGMKLLLAFIDFLTIVLLVLLLRQNKLKLEAALLYAWSPLPIMYFGLDGHIDALGISLLLLFIFLVGKDRYISGAVSLGFAALAKLYPMFIVALLIRTGPRLKRFLMPAIPILLLAAGYWLYHEPTGGLFESLTVYSATWEFNGSVSEILYLFFDSHVHAHVMSGVLFLLWLGWVFYVDRTLVEKIFLAFLGFIVVAPVVQPWYLTWLAAIIVLRWSVAVFVLLGLSTLSNFVVYSFRLTGFWQDQIALLLIEYLPFYALLVWEVVRGRFRVSSPNLVLGPR